MGHIINLIFFIKELKKQFVLLQKMSRQEDTKRKGQGLRMNNRQCLEINVLSRSM